MPNVLGRYEIFEELGRGAMGVVYKARDPVLGRIVAIKTMPAEVADDDELRRRLAREAEAAARLKHPNIITVHDYGEEDGVPFIAMEFLEGIDLKQILRNKVALYPSEKVGILRQVALGLGHAHRAGVVHRDIKPANIRILRDGTVKIMDFGIARLASSQLTRVGTVLGSVDYMSPEQVEGRQVDPRCDVFCYGVVAYELVTHRVPFKGPNMPATMKNILEAKMPPIEDELLKPFPGIDEVIRRCLQREPDRRYESFQEVARKLEGMRMEMGAGPAQANTRASEGSDATGSGPEQETVVLPAAATGEGSSSWQDGDQTVSSVQLWVDRERFQKIHSVIERGQKQRARSSRERSQRRLPGRASQPRGVSTSKKVITSADYGQAARRRKLLAVVVPIVLLAAVAGWFLFARGGSAPGTSSVSQFVARHLDASQSLSDQGDLPGAIAELERILDVAPDHEEASTRLAGLAERLDSRYEEAMTSARAALGESHFDTAIVSLESALALKPDDADARALLEDARAGASSAQTRAQTRRRFEELLAEGRAQLDAGRYDRAVASFEAASELRPSSPEANQLLTDARRRAGAERDAAEAYRAGVEALEKGDYALAVSNLERAVSLDGSHRQARERLAEARREQARPRYGVLTINALPFGEAFLDGESLGTTPVRLEQVPMGRHEIRVEKDGYRTFTRTVNVEEGQTTNVVAQLERSP